MSRFKMSKKASQSTHFRRRAEERLGFKINKQQRREIINMIQKQKAKFIRSESNRIKVWEVLYGGKGFRVIYDVLRHNLVTVLLIKEAV